VELPDKQIDPKAFERQIGDPHAVHVGLRSRVERDGYPDGFALALAPQAIDRLSDLGAIYGLSVVGRLRYGAGEYEQPSVSSKLEAAFMAKQLRWLSKVTIDPVILDAAERLAAIAEACKSSSAKTEELLIRYAT
jgi:hypothetical protein